MDYRESDLYARIAASNDYGILKWELRQKLYTNPALQVCH
ncbi:MAG: hypothetical protein ACI9BW_001490 [Gammaproteobacteria bacterium]|jgi:hypothetical protein